MLAGGDEPRPVLRHLVATGKQPMVRRSALRLLSADGDAADLFGRIAADKSEDLAARSTSAVALQSLAPEQFHNVARDIVLDDDDNKNVRATFVDAIAHGGEIPPSDVDQKVRSLAGPKALAAAPQDRAEPRRTRTAGQSGLA